MQLHNQRLRARELGKHALTVSRVKLFYTRITLTRFTLSYFLLALVGCIILVIVQVQAYVSNKEAATAVSNFAAQQGVSPSVGISFLEDGNVMFCKQGIYGQTGAQCKVLVQRAHSMHVRDISPGFEERADPDLQQCAISLMWLTEALKDAAREDLVTLVYHIWLFSLSVVTLLNESLPHLFAGLLARALAMGWSSFRVRGNSNLQQTYIHVINAGDCEGFDPMGSWWNGNALGSIVALVSNVLTLVTLSYMSYELHKVYASRTFSRVGTSKEINRLYLLVLLFSVSLQLAGFFTLAQTALWIGRISFGAIRRVAHHFGVYLADLIVTAVLEIPWLVLGWISVRREAKALFLLFSLFSLLLLGTASALFASPLYRFVLAQWSFFATISGTAYGLLILTSILAVICRLQFGKGLAHFLRVCDDLEGEDFTPVYFSKGDDSLDFDSKNEKSLDSELPALRYARGQDGEVPPAEEHKVSRISLFFATGKETIKLTSAPDMYRRAMEDKAPAPIIVNPLDRSSSRSTRASSSISVAQGAEAKTISPISRVATAGGGKMDTAEPPRPPQAAFKSTPAPRFTGASGLPRRPSDGKPPGNYF